MSKEEKVTTADDDEEEDEDEEDEIERRYWEEVEPTHKAFMHRFGISAYVEMKYRKPAKNIARVILSSLPWKGGKQGLDTIIQVLINDGVISKVQHTSHFTRC